MKVNSIIERKGIKFRVLSINDFKMTIIRLDDATHRMQLSKKIRNNTSVFYTKTIKRYMINKLREPETIFISRYPFDNLRLFKLIEE